MTEEPWNKHTPGDPMPCKCGESVVEAKMNWVQTRTAQAKYLGWKKIPMLPEREITAWRFVERKGEDVIASPRDVLTPAEPQLLALLSVATDDEADAIRSAARRANIEVPE